MNYSKLLQLAKGWGNFLYFTAVLFGAYVEMTVCRGRKADIGTDNKAGKVKFFEHFLFKGDHGILLIVISREEAKSDGDSFRIHEQSHLHDGKRAVLLADAILFIVLRLFDFKIEVSAVIVNDFCFSFCQCGAVAKQTALDIVRLFRNDRQGTVNIVEFKGRRFNKAPGILKASFARKL